MTNNLISVIVPVYKVEDYLGRCVESIRNQTYKSIEIILVDDGSPDNCPTICDEYAEKDKRIKVIHKSNGGVSSARNAGIAASCGDFIMFVDSDDFLSPEYVNDLISKFDESLNPDIVIGGFTWGCNGKRKVVDIDEERVVSLRALKKDFDYFYNETPLNNVFSKIYKKSLLAGCLFNTKLSIGEDYVFDLNYYERCSKILFVKSAGYFYNTSNATSAMTKYNKNRFACEREVYCAAKRFKYGEVKFTHDAIDHYFCGVGIRQVVDICSQKEKWSCRKAAMRDVLEDGLYKEVVSKSYSDHGTATKLLRTLCKNRNYGLLRLAVFARRKLRKIKRAFAK